MIATISCDLNNDIANNRTEPKTANANAFFQFYVWSANWKDFFKVWKIKFRLWHDNLPDIVDMSLGQKNLKSCQMNVLEQSLSSLHAFPILVNKKPYQKYIKNTQNAVFNFWPTKFGALPILAILSFNPQNVRYFLRWYLKCKIIP